jgi:hypothetical protein
MLAEVDAHLNRNEAAAAMERLATLIGSMPKQDLELARPDIEQLLSRFFPKRRRVLEQLLQARLGRPPQSDSHRYPMTEPVTRTERGAAAGQVSAPTAEAKRAEYSERLNTLRDRHIFQWSTAYRDTVTYVFKDLLQLTGTERHTDFLHVASIALTLHSADIFSRGFNYITATQAAAADVALAKSVSGLQRFLFLVIDSYSAAVADIRTRSDALALRAVTSAMLQGVLQGYAGLSLGFSSGWDLLERFPMQWAHALPFLTGPDLSALIDDAPESDFKANLAELVAPTLLALDRTIQAQPQAGRALPRVGRFGVQPARLEILLSPSSHQQRSTIRVVCILTAALDDPAPVDNSIAAGATLVIARVSKTLWHSREDAWHTRVADGTRIGSFDDHEHSLSERVFSALQAEMSYVSSPYARPTISHNYAADFPLGDPIVRQFYLVQRQSVRRLLNAFLHGTGAHVWCSVRRSGKTTATVDLAGDTERTVVVIQTMDQQPSQPDLNLFYARVLAALENPTSLPATFFEQAVQDCSLASSPAKLQQARKVFIVDEYETLFGLLNAAARRDDWVRFAVVQPLLSQMVAFSSNNLLVFLGQRPDAHFILMSQNQLSPLVQQDSFPLFEHHQQSTATEFSQFLTKVLTEHLPFAPSFVDAVYEETGGHPYLTVNLLIDFCQWLIENNRHSDGLRLSSTDFDGFSKDRLVPAVLQKSPHYSTFNQMIADNLSEATRDREPWLYAVATILQRIGKQHPKVLSCSEVKYKELASDVAQVAKTSPGQLLQTADMANFLSARGGQVRPTIRLLGRLAAVAAAEVN